MKETTAEINPLRRITDHKLNGLNDAITITVLDAPGSGGASHQYEVALDAGNSLTKILARIEFQNGPIGEAGFNGISGEALVAIVIDRLRSFQAGEYKCKENACALTHFEEGLMWLQKRTRDRLARGVEGTHQK